MVQKILFVSGLLLMGSASLSLARYQRVEATAGGRLEIPRLKLSVAILDKDDDHSLALGAGHIPGTSPVGSLGNAALAGHRDTVFRPLEGIRIGDRIETHTNHHATYIVDVIKIVDPADASLLLLNDSPTLTLVTCYPFHYVGAAPKRFVVQARLTL